MVLPFLLEMHWVSNFRRGARTPSSRGLRVWQRGLLPQVSVQVNVLSNFGPWSRLEPTRSETLLDYRLHRYCQSFGLFYLSSYPSDNGKRLPFWTSRPEECSIARQKKNQKNSVSNHGNILPEGKGCFTQSTLSLLSVGENGYIPPVFYCSFRQHLRGGKRRSVSADRDGKRLGESSRK